MSGREPENGPPEPSAWLTPVTGSTGWGYSLMPTRQNATSVPLFTLAAAERVIRERVVAEMRAEAARLEALPHEVGDVPKWLGRAVEANGLRNAAGWRTQEGETPR